MSNEIIIKNKIYTMHNIWRKSKNDKSKDIRGKLFPYPSIGNGISEAHNFIDKLKLIELMLEQKYYNKITHYKKELKCLLCNKKNISTKKYVYKRNIWEDGLKHYIEVHGIVPDDDFIDLVLNSDIEPVIKNINIIGKIKANHERTYADKHNLESHIRYIKVKSNQIMILDALMKHGGYTKKYSHKNIFRYSEHAGILDIHLNGLDKIIVSGNTARVDKKDEEIYLPNALPDMLHYEYIFHTHPPTPKPGGRVDVGILYEFPSIGDMFHFIEHFNEGKTIGSIVITPEGLYNIRKSENNKIKIIINEDDFYDDIRYALNHNQKKAIIKYGTEFNTYFFYSKIAQDITFINNINDVLLKYELKIDFFPRVKDKNTWIITDIHLPIFID